MDTRELEIQCMQTAAEAVYEKKHTPDAWESFLGGAIHILECRMCRRFAIVEVLPKGDDDSGNQVYKTDIRGSAPTTECGQRKVN